MVIDKSGIPVIPPPIRSKVNVPNDNIEKLTTENRKLEVELGSVKQNYEKVIEELSLARGTNDKLRSDLQKCNSTICNLEVANKNATESAKILNKKSNETKKLHEEEKSVIFKEHRNEIKAWRKDLGKAVNNHLKLEKKLAALEAKDSLILASDQDPYSKTSSLNKLEDSQGEICTICSHFIPNYIPDNFMGEIINPACKQCKGSGEDGDIFASFPESGMSISLVTHWSPPPTFSTHNLGSLLSPRSHYVVIPNPGDTFVSPQEFLRELKQLWDEERKAMRSECSQS